jgi:hypothetical protein
VAQLDDYLRRIKSTMIAEVLTEFPVEIHGFNWDHFDFSGKRVRFFQGGDYTRSKERIVASLGLVDMSPNTQRAPHDRPMRAFGLYTLCLTNEQTFFREQFNEVDAFSFRFDRDHLRETVANTLAHPKRSVELGLTIAEQFRRDYPAREFAQFMLDTASHIRLASGQRHPGLQDFFVWPPTKL